MAAKTLTGKLFLLASAVLLNKPCLRAARFTVKLLIFILYVFWCTGAAGQMDQAVHALLIAIMGFKAVAFSYFVYFL